ncbi:uncharacterized protein F5147DRAFT_666027 [Suillus discolor]|uniref:Uncharacterized protein n=1 Tax=Suillus discolor TaxID=1912936 RepID=A0A9P7K0Q5_9AGAM|nr:uncharacterized protein F5147DRAFT_666027 [Suillus discolor]KAG2119931.1 hypothetical protein F5147DRAFT_666027 [Suillus discolor]
MSLRLIGICKVVKMALDYVDRPIHLSFDIDALGPSVAPNADKSVICLHAFDDVVRTEIPSDGGGHSTLTYADILYIVYPVPLGLGTTKTSICCRNVQVHDG